MIKKYDCVVVVGEYTDKQGQPKKRYQNVGSVMQGDNGPFIIMERWFNPAGLPNPDNRSSCIVSLFEPKPRDGQQQQAPSNQAAQNNNGQQPQNNGSATNAYEDDIPF